MKRSTEDSPWRRRSVVLDLLRACVRIAEYKATSARGCGERTFGHRRAPRRGARRARRALGAAPGTPGARARGVARQAARARGHRWVGAPARGRAKRHLRRRPRPRVEDLRARRRARGPSLAVPRPRHPRRGAAHLREDPPGRHSLHELQHYEGVEDEGAATSVRWRGTGGRRAGGRPARREEQALGRVGSGLRSRQRGRRKGRRPRDARLLTAGERGCYKCVTVVPALIPPGRSRYPR